MARLASSQKIARPVDESDVSKLGHVVRHDAGQTVLDVHKDAVNRVVTRALAELPGSDFAMV